MKILSVDYGDARTGVAVCDKDEILASPVCVVSERDRDALVGKLAAIAAEQRAGAIVVGEPVNMDGSRGARAQACRELALLLAERTGLPTDTYDERLTTVMAHNALSGVNVRGKKRKQVVDAVSAVMILEDYLRYRKNTVHNSEE